MNGIDFQRLLELKNIIDSGNASRSEKKEYMELLFRNGNITEKQYDQFLKGQNTDDIIGAGLVIGGVLLATWLIGKLID